MGVGFIRRATPNFSNKTTAPSVGRKKAKLEGVSCFYLFSVGLAPPLDESTEQKDYIFSYGPTPTIWKKLAESPIWMLWVF